MNKLSIKNRIQGYIMVSPILLSFLLLIPFSFQVTAQEKAQSYFYNLEIGKKIAEDYVFKQGFIGEYAKVKSNGLWGIIDKKGSKILPFIYKQIGFNKKTAPYFDCLRNDKWGVVDAQNKTITPFKYDNAVTINFNDSLYIILEKKGRLGIVDLTGKTIFPFEYTNFRANKNQILAFKTNKTLNEIRQLPSDEKRKVFSNAKIAFYNKHFKKTPPYSITPSNYKEYSTRIGMLKPFIGVEGNFLIDFNLPLDTIGGLTRKLNNPKYIFPEASKYKHLNVIKEQQQSRTPIDNAFIVKQQKKALYKKYTISAMGIKEGEPRKLTFGVIDFNGKSILPENAFKSIVLHNGVAKPKDKDELQWLQTQFAAIPHKEKQGIYTIFYFDVSDTTNYKGIYSLTGKPIITLKDSLYNATVKSEGIVVTKLGYPHIPENEKISNNKVAKQPMAALYSHKGEQISPFKYGELSDFENNKAIVKGFFQYDKKGQLQQPIGLINTKGEFVIPYFRYQKIEPLYSKKENQQDYYKVQKTIPHKNKSDEWLYGITDGNGKEILSVKYHQVFALSKKHLLLKIHLEGKNMDAFVFDLSQQKIIATFTNIYTIYSAGDNVLRITKK